MSPRPYPTRAPSDRTRSTRERITRAVRELLTEGTFHASSVEQVAARAGVSRATVYQHFGSRLDLVDAMCESFDANPALLALRKAVGGDDPARAVAETIALSVEFWASEDAVLRELYGVAAVDPAARDLVARQRNDRRSELERLARGLHRAGLLRQGVGERRALSILLVLTSYETYRELREDGQSDRQAAVLLQDAAARLLLR